MDQRDMLCALGLFETRWILANAKRTSFEEWVKIYAIWAGHVHRY